MMESPWRVRNKKVEDTHNKMEAAADMAEPEPGEEEDAAEEASYKQQLVEMTEREGVLSSTEKLKDLDMFIYFLSLNLLLID